MDMAGSSTPAPDNGSSEAFVLLRRRTKASERKSKTLIFRYWELAFVSD